MIGSPWGPMNSAPAIIDAVSRGPAKIPGSLVSVRFQRLSPEDKLKI